MKTTFVSLVLGVTIFCGSAGAMGRAPKTQVKLPGRLMFGTEILEEIHRQTGKGYAYPSGLIVHQIDAGQFAADANFIDIAAQLAPSAEVELENGILVFTANVEESSLRKWQAMLENQDPDQRRLAAYNLARLQSKQAIPALCLALEDKNQSVRQHALRSLRRIEHDFRSHSPPGRVSLLEIVPDFPAGILEHLMTNANDRSEHEWMLGAELLGRRGHKASAALIRKGLNHDYTGVRETAGWALERMETGWHSRARKKTQPLADSAFLLRNERREKDINKRAEIILKLGRTGGKEVWSRLIVLLDSDNPTIRRAAMRALRHCPDPAAVEPLMQWVKGKGVASEDRNLAAMSLGLIASDKAVKTLSEYIMKAELPMSASVLGLGYTCDEKGLNALIRAASWPKESRVLKGYAFMGLARLGNSKAVDTLLKHRGQRNNIARSIAYAAIRQAGKWNQSAVNAFIKRTMDGHPAAPHGLELTEDPRAVDALLAKLPGSKGSQRLRIIQSLGRIGDSKAIPGLVQIMNKDESQRDQYMAMRALRWRWFWHQPEVQKALAAHPLFRTFIQPAPSLEEQEENTWVLRRWPVDRNDDRSAATSYEAGLAFDSHNGRVVKWGSHGFRCDSPQTGDTWLFDPETAEWNETSSPRDPHGMCGTWGTTYDQSARAVVSVQAAGATHGWQWVRGRAMRAASPWVYDTQRDKWLPMQRVDRSHGPGMRGFHSPAYHEKAQVSFFYGGQMGNLNSGDIADRGWIYDAYVNRWMLTPPSDPLPGKRAHQGMCYLPNLNRIMMVGGSYFKSDRLTWLYDLENNRWKNAEPSGTTPRKLPIVYDPVTETVLHFEPDLEEGTRVTQYDPKANAWKEIPSPQGPSPHHRSIDVAYDSHHNVYIMDGGHLSWDTGHIAVRETWTYKFRKREPAPESGLKAPENLNVITLDKGKILLSWEPVSGSEGYVIYRGAGKQPWQRTLARVSTVPLTSTEFQETLPESGKVAYYRVAAIDADFKEGPHSMMVRTQPGLVRDVVASVRKDRSVRIAWEPSSKRDVAGYNVYAGSPEIGRKMHPSRMFRNLRPLKKLNEAPIRRSEFMDSRPLAKTSGLFSHEIRVYTVRAVNRHGVEGGDSAMTLTFASSTPDVRAQERCDGTTVVEWDEAPEKHIQGYKVYRMDEFPRSLTIALNYAPIKETRFVDEPELPRSERRIYYVTTIDALGQEGAPSTGAHAFGRP